MSETLGDQPTYYDVAKRLDPDGGIASIVELLVRDNPIMEDAVVMEGNLPTGHRTTVRTGIPDIDWRMLNYGVQKKKSSTQQVDDSCGQMASYSEIDVDLANLNNNSAAWRLSEDKPFLEAFAQQGAETLIYGDISVSPERFHGMSPRYTTTSGGYGTIGWQVVESTLNNPGTNTSIWFHTWSTDSAFMTFPKGMKVGIQVTDKGQQTVQDERGGQYEAYRTHFKWDLGFVLKDYRYTSVLRNVDVTTLTDPVTGTGGTDRETLLNEMIVAYNRMKRGNGGRSAIYCSRSIKTALDIAVNEKNNVNLTVRDYAGRPTTHFYELPIRVCDAITDTEQDMIV